jgi:hypothetical protein
MDLFTGSARSNRDCLIRFGKRFQGRRSVLRWKLISQDSGHGSFDEEDKARVGSGI